jgi:hypothetical protein
MAMLSRLMLPGVATMLSATSDWTITTIRSGWC